MLGAAQGLTTITSEDLKKALAALHRGQLSFPLTVETLTCVGLQHAANDLLEILRGLDERAVRAVLVAVIAERMPENKNRPARSDF